MLTTRLTMDLQPFGDRIIVNTLDTETVTRLGVIIPDNAKSKSDRATVLAVGPGKKNKQGVRVAPTVKPNDTVLFVKGAGIRVNHKGQDYLVLGEDDIYGIIEP